MGNEMFARYETRDTSMDIDGTKKEVFSQAKQFCIAIYIIWAVSVSSEWQQTKTWFLAPPLEPRQLPASSTCAP